MFYFLIKCFGLWCFAPLSTILWEPAKKLQNFLWKNWKKSHFFRDIYINDRSLNFLLNKIRFQRVEEYFCLLNYHPSPFRFNSYSHYKILATTLFIHTRILICFRSKRFPFVSEKNKEIWILHLQFTLTYKVHIHLRVIMPSSRTRLQFIK